MSNVLFLHHNYPAQFRYLVEYFSSKTYAVHFVCDTCFLSQGEIDILSKRNIFIHKTQYQKGVDRHEGIDGQLRSAKRFKRTIRNLTNIDFIACISHAGWGCGYYAKEIFPKSKHISYLEWYFSSDLEEYTFASYESKWSIYTKDSIDANMLKNATIDFELVRADAIVSPTNYQSKHLPLIFRNKLHIIYDYVNLPKLPNGHLTSHVEHNSQDRFHITYTTRGFEAMRGYPSFIKAMELVLAEKNLSVNISVVGNDRVSYGKTKEGFSFKEWGLEKLEDALLAGSSDSSFRFYSYLEFNKYIKLLMSSDMHFYFSRPFVTSWSALDAMATGCNICSNKIEPHREIFCRKSTWWTDEIMSPGATFGVVLSALDELKNNHDTTLARRRANRDAIKVRHSISNTLQKWESLLTTDI